MTGRAQRTLRCVALRPTLMKQTGLRSTDESRNRWRRVPWTIVMSEWTRKEDPGLGRATNRRKETGLGERWYKNLVEAKSKAIGSEPPWRCLNHFDSQGEGEEGGEGRGRKGEERKEGRGAGGGTVHSRFTVWCCSLTCGRRWWGNFWGIL
jgi:hypothetical protein